MTIDERNFRERTLALFSGGSNGEYGIPPELVPVLERGAGCRVWDTEGREFLDMTMAWRQVWTFANVNNSSIAPGVPAHSGVFALDPRAAGS